MAGAGEDAEEELEGGGMAGMVVALVVGPLEEEGGFGGVFDEGEGLEEGGLGEGLEEWGEAGLEVGRPWLAVYEPG